MTDEILKGQIVTAAKLKKSFLMKATELKKNVVTLHPDS